MGGPADSCPLFCRYWSLNNRFDGWGDNREGYIQKARDAPAIGTNLARISRPTDAFGTHQKDVEELVPRSYE